MLQVCPGCCWAPGWRRAALIIWQRGLVYSYCSSKSMQQLKEATGGSKRAQHAPQVQLTPPLAAQRSGKVGVQVAANRSAGRSGAPAPAAGRDRDAAAAGPSAADLFAVLAGWVCEWGRLLAACCLLLRRAPSITPLGRAREPAVAVPYCFHSTRLNRHTNAPLGKRRWTWPLRTSERWQSVGPSKPEQAPLTRLQSPL